MVSPVSSGLLQGFVFTMSILRELYDDLKRYFRDKGTNGQKYYKLTSKGNEALEEVNHMLF